MILPNLSTKTIFRKTTALLVTLSFAFSNVVFADITKNPAPDETSKQVEIVSDPAKIVVPRDYGLVKSIFTGKDKRLIIHIQDAHCNFEAQSNITKILENLIKNYGLTLVSVEGADGFIDTSWFKAFPDEEVRKEVATYFMKKGEITGPEFLSITTDYPIKLFGAETRSYYIENLNAFTSSYTLKEDTEKYFNQIKAVLNKLKNYVYSDELKAIDAKIQDYESKKLQFTDYVKFLQGLAAAHKINLRQYENLFKLISVLIYEKKIDFNVVDKERSVLIDELTKKLTKEALTELVNNSLSFKTGKISSAEYYDYLKKLCLHHGFELSKDYPNLFNYIIYNSVYSRIENEKLFKDIKGLEIAIKEKLFINDGQRTLERLYRHIEILLGLVNIKLLNGDFDYYKFHKEEFAHEIFADFIKKMVTRYGFAFELDSPSDAIKENMSRLEDFYAIAVKRDKALLDNTLQAMRRESIQVAALVTGGFHSEGITKMLENNGISYMVICPNITKDVETPYIKILTNQRTPLEEILADTGAATEPKSAKQGMLAPYLISAALLNIEELREIKGLGERTEADLKEWAVRHIRLWLPEAQSFAAKMKIELTPQLAAAYFNISVNKAVDSYIKNNHLDKSKAKDLRGRAENIKALAKDVIAELLAAKTTDQAPVATDILTQQQWRLLDEAAKAFNLNEPYKLYLAQMWAQYLLRQAGKDDKKPLRIATDRDSVKGEENFILTSLLAKDENSRREFDHRTLKRSAENASAAGKAVVTINPMDAGRGENFVRVEHLAKRLGVTTDRVKLTAKGTDIGFEIKYKNQDKPVFISIAEARLLQLIIAGGKYPYAKTRFQPIVNWESKEPYEKLMDSICLLDRFDPAKKEKRTYRQALEGNGINILPMIEQTDLPGINTANNTIAINLNGAHQPGGHGQLGFMFLYNSYFSPPPDDGKTYIRFFFNGDNVNARADPSIVGAMARHNWPIVKVTTIAAPIDKKGGKDGERKEVINGKTVYVPDQMELADAQDAEKKQAGQESAFISAGQPGGLGVVGEQRFNTNLIYINETTLNSIFKALLDRKIIAKEKLYEIISPLLIAKKAKKAGDGQTYYPIDGAIGVAVHNLNAFFAASADPRVKQVLTDYGIDRLLYLVNIPLEERTETFAPIKKSYDSLLLAYSDYCRLNTDKFILEDTGTRLVPPEFKFSAPNTLDAEGKDSWWDEVQNVIDSLGGARLKELDSLQIKNRVALPNSILAGIVIIESESKNIVDLNKKLSQFKQGGRLVLKNVKIKIRPDGTIWKSAIVNNISKKSFFEGQGVGAIREKEGSSKNLLSSKKPADIITQGVGAGHEGKDRGDMGKIDIAVGLDRAVNGDENAYKTIVRTPRAKLIAYLEPFVKGGLDKLPEDLFGFGKGYDVRGNAQPVAGGVVDLGPLNVYIIGKLIGTYYAEAGDKMLVTGDIRIHTPIIRYMLALGASSVGVNAEYAPDLLTTGAHNLLSTDNEGNYKVMAQVSGSHGVPQKNGLKIKAFLGKKDARVRMILEPLYAERLEGLYWKNKAAGERQTNLREEAETGSVKEITGLAKDVVNTLNKTLPPTKKDEIVVIDPRAGAAGPIILELLKERGFSVIDMDKVDKEGLVSRIRAIWNIPGIRNGKFRVAVMLNAKPDGNMSRGIWDPSKPEALKDAIELVNLINSNPLSSMPKAFGAVFDGDADRITAILEDGTGVPVFEMTLPYYQRFLLNESNQEVMVRLSKTGFGPVMVVCDVRANSKLLALIDKVNEDLRKMANIYDKNILEGWFITTGYPPQLGFMNNRIAQLDKFVNSKPELNKDKQFMEKFSNFKRTYFTAEASGHNFFHVSERYPDRVLDDAIAGFFTLLNIRETLTPAEAPVVKQDILLTDLFANFPHAYSSNEIRIPVPNADKIAVATETGAWMKERYGRELKPYTPPTKEDDYLIQPKDDGYVTVSGFKVQLKDGRSALVRWSNTGEELTTIFEGRDLASLISITREITERLRLEVKRSVNVSNLDKEIARLEEIQKHESNAQEKLAAAIIGQKLHTPLSPVHPEMAARFPQGGYNQSGYGIPVGAAIDGSFAIGGEGSQGYYVDMTDRGISGRDLFVSDAAKMRKLFASRAQEGKPIRLVVKPGIGGQHTPFQGIASGIQVIDAKRGVIVGEYELGKDYESELNKVLKTLGIGWDQIAVIPSSKSGSTDETMMIFTEVFYAMLKNIVISAGFNKTNAGNFAQIVFEAMNEMNFPGGKELKGAEIFKNMTLDFVMDKLKMKEMRVDKEQVRRIFAMTLRNMIFETTERPESSRLAAFLASPLVQSLEENDKPVVIPMFDNVGGRWTADLHMMTFLAYNDLNADEYWQIRYKGIKEVRAETHAGYKLGEKIVDDGITDIALVLPEELFWFGKAIEQNFNESIWQDAFANLIAIKEGDWEYQEKYYAGNPSKLAINLSSLNIPQNAFNLFNLGPVNLKNYPNDQASVNKLGELFTLFYGMTHTVGNRLIVSSLAAKEYKAANVDLNNLDNPATRIVQQNLYTRQPYVELGKELLEEKLKALQAEGSEAVKAEFKKNISLAAQKRLESKVPSIPSGNVSNVKELADCLYNAVKYAESTNRKFVPFIYLEGEKFYGLREHLVKLGIEWVMQGTGDQHINYQQVLAQPQKYLPFIVSFLPKDTEEAVSGRPAIGFAKGYLNNVSPHMVRDLFAEMSYRALTESRKNESGGEVKGAAGIFLRMIDIEPDRALLTESFDMAMVSTEEAKPEVAVSASFDHTHAAILQSSATGESVRDMAVEKFKYDKKMHLIFVKRAIPQIQLSTTTAINLANICEKYYNTMEGYTAHIVDSYEDAVELLAKNSDWNKTNTIVGLVDTEDLEAMSKNLTANDMKDKTKLLAMEKFSEDQFIPIKGFFDLMSVMVRINKPLDATNDSELIDGLRRLLNEIGVRDVNSLVDALSAGAYFEDPIKFAKNFILRLLPPAKPRDTKELKALYDAAKKVVESL